MTKFRYTKQSCSNYVGIGTDNGGYICEWDPFSLHVKIARRRGVHSIVVWQMSNLVIFLERCGDTSLFVWDIEQKKVWDVIKTTSGVQELQCVDDILVVITAKDVLLYELPSLKLTQTIKDVTSPFCYKEKYKWFGRSSLKTLQIKGHATTIQPHKNTVSAIAMDSDIVTVSEKGTIVRVWNSSGKQMWEGRRGLEPAKVVSADIQGSLVVVATSKGSIHCFETTSKSSSGYLWTELPKSRYTWYVGESPFVQIQKENAYIADASGLITIVSLESGETLFQTSLLGDAASPFSIPLG